MESILNSVKQTLNLNAADTSFDVDVTIYINAAFSALNQLGLGPVDGYFITDSTDEWEALGLPDNQLHMTKSYVYLSTRMLFDPPATSFHVNALESQKKELEWRLNALREDALPDPEEVAP